MRNKGQQELVEKRKYRDENSTKMIEIEVGMVTGNIYSVKIHRNPKKAVLEGLDVYSEESLQPPLTST